MHLTLRLRVARNRFSNHVGDVLLRENSGDDSVVRIQVIILIRLILFGSALFTRIIVMITQNFHVSENDSHKFYDYKRLQ